MNKLIVTEPSVSNHQYELSDVEEVVISSNVKYLGNRAFFHCEKLKNVVFEGRSIELGSECFEACTSLRSIKLPRMTHVPFKCFYGCKYLRDVVFPDNLTVIDAYAFSGCNFRKLEFPESLLSIGSYAFSNSGHYDSLHFKNVEHLGDGAFEGCQIDYLEVGKTIERVPSRCFGRCKLKYVKILETVPRGAPYEYARDKHIYLDCYSFHANPNMTIKLPKYFNYSNSAFYINDHPWLNVYIKEPYKDMKILFPSSEYGPGNIYTNRTSNGYMIPFDFYDDKKENK